jgi:hypothetical protein
MGSKLRTWMGSWQVWVIVACLAYLWGVRGQGPRIVAIWPWGGWIAVGLMLLALIVLSWFLLKYIVVPFLMFLQGEKKGGRTAKAKEKFADSLMSFSTAVFSAIVISVLVFPFTAFIQTMARGTDPVAAVVSGWPPAWWSGWHTAVFLILYWVPLSVAMLFRKRALDLYDELSPPTPAVAPTAQGTHEQSTIPDPGPPVYIKANGGSRRRRRHRGT